MCSYAVLYVFCTPITVTKMAIVGRNLHTLLMSYYGGEHFSIRCERSRGHIEYIVDVYGHGEEAHEVGELKHVDGLCGVCICDMDARGDIVIDRISHESRKVERYLREWCEKGVLDARK